MRPFILDGHGLAKLNKLRKYAEANPIEVDELLDIFNGQAYPVADRPEFTTEIPVGVRVVYCIEHQKMGYARHLSVSVHPLRKGKMPNPVIVGELMKIMGF